MLRIGALVSGGGTNLQAIIDAVERKYINAEIVLVVSSNKNAYALERAHQHHIPSCIVSRKTYTDREEYTQKVVDCLKESNVDLVLTCGFMVILTPTFVNAFSNRILNIHPALIPAFSGAGFYGLKVHEAALAKGVKITGATVHFVTEGTDEGPIVLQKAVEVMDDDTAESLQKRVMEQAEQIIYPEAVKLYCENKLVIDGNIVRRLNH